MAYKRLKFDKGKVVEIASENDTEKKKSFGGNYARRYFFEIFAKIRIFKIETSSWWQNDGK